jgi:chaperone required for assembly of F1-ATPase
MPDSSNNAFIVSPKTKKDVIKKEIARLLDIDFIQEVYHPDWLDNLVLVSKKNKEWSVLISIMPAKWILSSCLGSI